MRRGGSWRVTLTDEALQDFAREAKRLKLSIVKYEAQHGGPDHYLFQELYPNLHRLCERVINIDEDRRGEGG